MKSCFWGTWHSWNLVSGPEASGIPHQSMAAAERCPISCVHIHGERLHPCQADPPSKRAHLMMRHAFYSMHSTVWLAWPAQSQDSELVHDQPRVSIERHSQHAVCG